MVSKFGIKFLVNVLACIQFLLILRESGAARAEKVSVCLNPKMANFYVLLHFCFFSIRLYSYPTNLLEGKKVEKNTIFDMGKIHYRKKHQEVATLKVSLQSWYIKIKAFVNELPKERVPEQVLEIEERSRNAFPTFRKGTRQERNRNATTKITRNGKGTLAFILFTIFSSKA